MIAINPDEDPEPHSYFSPAGHLPSETSKASSNTFEFWSLKQIGEIIHYMQYR